MGDIDDPAGSEFLNNVGKTESEQPPENGPVAEAEDNLENIVFHKSLLAEGPMIVLFFVLLFLASYLTNRYPGSVQQIGLFEAGGRTVTIGLPGFLLVPLLVLMHVLHSMYDHRYIIGDTYIRGIHGLLSLKKKDVRIDYRDVLGIEIDRSLYGRIVNVGDLKIGSAMMGEAEIVWYGVRDPSRMRDITVARINKYVVDEERDTNLPHVRHRSVRHRKDLD